LNFLRYQLLREADRLSASDGKLIILDFDSAWKKQSIIAYVLIYLIERIAGKERFQNGRDFLKQVLEYIKKVQNFSFTT
jgi:hypothetical protein